MIKLGIVGASGLVGGEILSCLEERDLDVELYLFGSKKSRGRSLNYRGQDHRLMEVKENSLKGLDYIFFAAGGEVSRSFASLAARNGSIVIDNSSEFRMEEGVPLIIPEVNPQAIKDHQGIIANPNCSTIQSVLAIYPIFKDYGIKRLVYTSYQAVSGSGYQGLEDLERTLAGDESQFYLEKIAYNLIPQIDDFLGNGYTKEEMKMINETSKILASKIPISATGVRVPVRYGHAVSINLETEESFKMEEVFKLYETSPIENLVLKDDIEKSLYPTPLNIEDGNKVYVGRLRQDYSMDRGINLWCVANNIRKGASSNAVDILELLIGLEEK